jgi:three-Cys-motif partner protein
MSFFKEPQAAAILKHGLLKRYLPIFAMKTGSVAGEVAYLDCYAGPGLYSDGSDGSPSLALATANAIATSRGKASLHGHLVEQDPEAVASLRKLLAHQMTAWHVYQGRAEDHVPTILAGLKPSTPMFAFVDPFGLPIPFDTVVDLMKHGGRRVGYGRIGGAATELLMNFSTSAMRRVGGQLTGNPRAVGPVKARRTMITRMDGVLGGDWWRDIWRSQTPDRVDQIRDGYTERLRKAEGGEWATFDIGVSDRWQGPKDYSLLLFTQHEDGVWAFHESLSSANEEYRHYCHLAQGILDFEPLAPVHDCGIVRVFRFLGYEEMGTTFVRESHVEGPLSTAVAGPPGCSTVTRPEEDTIAYLTGCLRDFVRERGWEQWHTPRNLALALAGEIGELCQLLRWAPEGSAPSAPAELLSDELADVAIFVLHMADSLNVDLAALVRRKLALNIERFPVGESPQ